MVHDVRGCIAACNAANDSGVPAYANPRGPHPVIAGSNFSFGPVAVTAKFGSEEAVAEKRHTIL